MAKMYSIPLTLRPKVTVLDDWELFATSVGIYANGLRANVGLHNGELRLSETLHLSIPTERGALAGKVAETIEAGKVDAATVEKHLLQLCDVLDGVLLQLEEQSKNADSKSESGDDEASLFLQDPEAWDDSVNGADLIETLRAVIERFVVLPPGAAYSVALWILHSYTLDAAFASPILYSWSPTKRCGKTTLLSILGLLCSRAIPTSNISAASVYRAVEKWHPTLIIDEADTFLRHNEELAGIINAGHTRATGFVIRVNQDTLEPELLSTWGAKAIAGIGRQRDTIEDRSIQIPMRRKTKDETVERLRADQTDRFAELKRMCVRWTIDHMDAIRDADPDLPDYLDDRAADNWRTLCAIAEVAGADCLKQAHEAIRKLYGEAGESAEDESPGIMLLSDLQDAFKSRDHGRITSASLLTELHDLEDRPWSEWGRQQKPITKMQVARLLKPFGIRPTTVRDGTDRGKGYRIEDCQDAFFRYLPPSQDVTGVTLLNNGKLEGNSLVTKDSNVTDEKTRKSAPLQDCHGVTLQKGVAGQKQTVEPANEVSDTPWENEFDEEF